jgi:hypothetical protein
MSKSQRVSGPFLFMGGPAEGQHQVELDSNLQLPRIVSQDGGNYYYLTVAISTLDSVIFVHESFTTPADIWRHMRELILDGIPHKTA